jgi:hypothetical protein
LIEEKYSEKEDALFKGSRKINYKLNIPHAEFFFMMFYLPTVRIVLLSGARLAHFDRLLH